MSLFAIIMPLYNKAPYVGRALESILAQTHEGWELWVVDDGSSDGSAEVVRRYNDPRIHLHQQANAGVGAARNKGVALSGNTPYLCFLDADDWWEPTFLAEMAVLVSRYPQAGLYGTSYYIVRNHHKRQSPIGVDEGFEEGEINYCQVYARTLCMPIWTGAMCMPRTVFEAMGGFPEDIKLGEDFMLWVKTALQHPVVLLNRPLSNYNQDADPAYRGTGHLTPPENNFLWHLQPLEIYERKNPDYKMLVDRLRCYDLKPYYLSRQYHHSAWQEIAKADWSLTDKATRAYYRKPLWWVRTESYVWQMAYTKMRRAKQWLDHAAGREWAIGIIQDGMEGVMSGNLQVDWIKHPYRDRWFADPFVLDVDDDQIVLLVEEYSCTKRIGSIAELTIDRRTHQIMARQTLLEKGSHLSFPAIKREGGHVYVYPENSASGRLDIYELHDDRLTYHATLCQQPLTDAVLTSFFGAERLYATSMPNPNANEIGLYTHPSADKPFTLQETIPFEGNNARMAGDFFEYKGNIYKPSQDCNGGYGRAIHLYSTTDGIHFTHHSTLTSTHPRYREGMHTLNCYKGVVAIDVVGYSHPILGKIIHQLVELKHHFRK